MEIELWVRVQPRAARNEITGWQEGGAPDHTPLLLVRLTAPPVEGAANKACLDFLAETLGLRRAELRLVSGEKSRLKRFRISGLSREALRDRVAQISS